MPASLAPPAPRANRPTVEKHQIGGVLLALLLGCGPTPDAEAPLGLPDLSGPLGEAAVEPAAPSASGPGALRPGAGELGCAARVGTRCDGNRVVWVDGCGALGGG